MNEIPRNAIFGDWKDAPIAEDAPTVDTPIGRPCLFCDKPIEDGDVGQMMPNWRDVWVTDPIHRECLIEWVLGPEWRSIVR